MSNVKLFVVRAADNGALEIWDATEVLGATPAVGSFGPNIYAGTDDAAGIDALKNGIAAVRK